MIHNGIMVTTLGAIQRSVCLKDILHKLWPCRSGYVTSHPLGKTARLDLALPSLLPARR